MAVQVTLTKDLLINASVRAASQTFELMAGLEVTLVDGVERDQSSSWDGVASLLTFTGDWVGAGMFCCDEAFACRLGSAMLGIEVDQINAEMLDGVGEMANMVLGNVKEALETHTGPMTLSIPTVVYGKNFMTRTGIHAPWAVARFACDDDEFEIRVCLQER